jgi:hypothetical protein
MKRSKKKNRKPGQRKHVQAKDIKIDKTPCETRHKQVRVEWDGRGADVDEDLAPLILALWRAGIDTMMSCQENRPGIAWICFPTPLDAKMFLDLVAVYPDETDVPFWETLYGRVAGFGSDGDWEYTVNVDDLGVQEDIIDGKVEATCIGPSDFMFDVSVRFPRTDLPLILERLQARRIPPVYQRPHAEETCTDCECRHC